MHPEFPGLDRTGIVRLRACPRRGRETAEGVLIEPGSEVHRPANPARSLGTNRRSLEMTDGSHLCLQQRRPIAERYGDIRVIQAQDLLPDFRGPRVQRLCLFQLTLECGQALREGKK